MTRERVVITGMGTINPLGNSVSEFWTNCIAGKSGVKRVTTFNIPSHMSQIAGIAHLSCEQESPEMQARSLLFAKSAAEEALQDAKLFNIPFTHERCGVFIATAIAEIALMEQSFKQNQNGCGYLSFVPFKSPYFGSSFFFNNVAQAIAIKYSFKGGAVTLATGCTGGNDAIGYALHMIRGGRIDIAVTGATEAPITPLVVAAFSKIGATSKRNLDPERASRPFDKDRDGFVLAEGCGIFVLESLSHALKRGATIYAEVAGMGSVNNCYHMTDIPQDGKSIAMACKLALGDAHIEPDEIDYINAHGSSTIQNDIAETHAFYETFGNRAETIPVTSVKSQLGHALSAANSLELITAVLSLRDHIIPPTINLDAQDSACSLNVIGNKALNKSVNAILKTSSGFSGIHSSLILKRMEL